MKYFISACLSVVYMVGWGAMVSSAVDLKKSNVIVITSEELKQGLYGQDLFGVLSAIGTKTGITVKSSSDVGAEDWLVIRGLPRDSSRNVLVLIDGMPLNDSYSESNEFEHVPPLELVERIVVYKPPMPVRFGGYTAAIEIFTKKDPAHHRSRVSGATGDYETRLTSLSTEGLLGKLSYILVMDYIETDNLTGERRTPPKENLIYGDRSYRKVSPALKLMYDVSDNSRISMYLQYVNSEKFFSDKLFRGEKEGRTREVLNFNVNYIRRSMAGSNLLLTLFRTSEAYKLNLMMHPDVREQNRYKHGMRVEWSSPLSGKHRLSLGGDYTYLYTRENLGSALALEDVSFYGVFVEDLFALDERTSFVFGMRLDNHSETDSAYNPYISVTYAPSESTSLYGIWNRSIRWPSLTEFNLMNPQTGLYGEKLEALELGVNRRIDNNVSVKFAFYRLKLQKESEFFMNTTVFPPVFYQRNAPDEIVSRGFETELNFTITKNLKAFLNHTYTEAERRPSGLYVNYGPPENIANAGLSYLDDKTIFQIVSRYASEAKGVQRMGGKPTSLEEWFVVDVAYGFKVARNLNLFVRGSNIFDVEYETFDGRPMFGRVIIGGLEASFP